MEKRHNSFRFDWLTVSFRPHLDVSVLEVLDKVCEILNVKRTDFILHKQGTMRGYNSSYRYLDMKNLSINFHDTIENQGSNINITGTGMDYFNEKQITKLLRWIVKVDGYFTRLDIAFDDFEKKMPVELFDDLYSNFRMSKSNSDIPLIISSKNSLNSLKFYESYFNSCFNIQPNITIGTRYSKCMVRAYNKGVEQKIPDFYWWRLEFQTKYDFSEIFVRAYLDNDLANCFVDFLNSYFRILDSDNIVKSNISLSKTNVRWKKFLTYLLSLSSTIPKIYI